MGDSVMNLVERYSGIIDLQGKIIDDMFALLCQHICVEEQGCIDIVRNINKAAALRESLGAEP